MRPKAREKRSILDYDYNQDRLLLDDERLLDTISIWQEVHDKLSRDSKGLQKDHMYIFLYKQRYFFDPDEKDDECIDLLYLETQHDLLHERYEHPKQDNLTMAALQLQIEKGDFHSKALKALGGGVIGAESLRFLPSSFLVGHKIETVEPSITTAYAKCKGMSEKQAKLVSEGES